MSFASQPLGALRDGGTYIISLKAPFFPYPGSPLNRNAAQRPALRFGYYGIGAAVTSVLGADTFGLLFGLVFFLKPGDMSFCKLTARAVLCQFFKLLFPKIGGLAHLREKGLTTDSL